MKKVKRALLVLDATCVILFRELSLLGLLDSVGAAVILPPAVCAESKLHWDESGHCLKGYPEIVVRPVAASDLLLDESLGKGERECIGLCLEDPNWRILVSDDRRAQVRAMELGVKTVDSRALLWILFVGGHISAARFAQGIHTVLGKK